MRNPKVDLKFMRSILNGNFKGHLKSIEMDKLYFNNDSNSDEDCLSLYKVCNDIKNGISISDSYLESLYTGLLPSIKRSKINNNELSIDTMNELNNSHDYRSIFYDILSKNMFNELDFIFAVILMNFAYYRVFKTFLIVSWYYEKKFKETVDKKDLIEFNQYFDQVIEYNKHFHVIKKQLTLDEIVDLSKQIEEHYVKFFGVKEIYVYGSIANGNTNQFSDLDLHIIVDKPKEQLTATAAMLSNYFTKLFVTEAEVITTKKDEPVDSSLLELFNGEIKIY